jgi:autotransporter-associated beta strand repeat
MKKFFILFAIFLSLQTVFAQRKMERMDRGVVAMYKSSSQIYISWRYLATDPENIQFNVYRQIGTAQPVKLNNSPIYNSTNLLTNVSNTSTSRIFVRPVLNGVENDEDGSFNLKSISANISRIVKDFNFAPMPEVSARMSMKFCWPADLDGDGKYDFVLDRQNYGAVGEDGDGGDDDFVPARVEAYSSEGQFLWRINAGPNVKICNGQHDMVTAYDMDGDGKAEVMMITSEGTVFADGTIITGSDGKVTNYLTSNIAGSAPQWLSIIDGETGIEIDRAEIPHFNELITARTDRWKEMGAHFIIAYLDGVNPSLVHKYKNRKPDGGFQGALATWRFINKKLVLQWSHLDYPDQHEFHQVRVADVNGDGCDDMVEGGYVISGKDGAIINRHKDIIHGDRHMIGDIDPDRPGLEHFTIQQNNPKTLGMALHDVATGETIKGVYMSGVGDVGRGTCAAFDTGQRGLQFFSTMDSYAMYDCKGNLTGGTGIFPCEAVWWGSNLSRWHLSSADGDGHNLIWFYYNNSSKNFTREAAPHFYNEGGGYYLSAVYGKRAAFWGDILGDWREELILSRRDDTGFAVLSTWDVTNIRNYCLMQNPAYRGQTTAKGYYQTADVDYYMAADMPLPPVPPVQKADLYYNGSEWIDNDNSVGIYADGKDIMFDIRGGNSTYTISANLAPSRVYIINPKGNDYIFSGIGKFTGEMDLIKSLQGTATLNGNHEYTGITRISEGRLFVNGNLASTVRVDARGIVGGNGKLNGGITLETGLNIEGGRIEPGNGAELGTLTIVGNVVFPGRNNLHFDIDQTKPAKNDSLKIEGDFTVTGTNHCIVINQLSPIQADTLTLLTFSGTSNATEDNFIVKGMEGVPYTLLFEANRIRLALSQPRSAGVVTWTGAENSIWNFRTKNFSYVNSQDFFVPGDSVYFNDDVTRKTINITETMPVAGLNFSNDTDYTISGVGVISGTGGLIKTGVGKLTLSTQENSFTGNVDFSDGTLVVSSLKDGGLASSIGAATEVAGNWIMRNATLQTSAQMATNRSLQIVGKLTVNNPNSNNSVLLSGNIGGAGTTLELTGAGTLTLSGRNTLTNVIVHNGLLLLGTADANRYALGSSKITLMGGTFRMFDINSTGDTDTFTNDIEVPEGSSARLDLSSRWRLSGKLTGGGNITVNIPYVRSDLNGDWSQFTGIVNFTGRDVRLNSTLSRNISKAEVNLGSGVTVYTASNGSGEASSGQTFTFGALSGSGNISGRNSLVIGAKNINTTYSGAITAGGGSLSKYGTGVFTVTGANLYTGNTNIVAGTLLVCNTTGSGTGTGNVFVRTGATLAGTGTVGGTVTIDTGGFISAGDKTLNTTHTNRIGTFTIDKNLNTTGTIKLETRNTTNYPTDKIIIKGNLSVSGNLLVEDINGTTPFPLNAELHLLEVTGTISGEFTNIELPITALGTKWDTSTLLTNGRIRVVQETAINNIENDDLQVFVNENNKIVVKYPIATSATINVLNTLGQILIQQSVNSTETVIKQNLVSGVYFVKIENTTNKVIIR